MKRLIRALLVAVLAVGALGASFAHADEDGGGKWDHGRGGHGMHMGWGKALGLSDKQVDKIKALAKENFAAMKPLRRELRDENFKLRDAMEDKDMSAIKSALDQLDATRKKLDAAREKFRSGVSDILDPMQRAEAYLMMERRLRGGEGGRWGRDRAGWGGRGAWGRRRLRDGECGMERGRGEWRFGGADRGCDSWRGDAGGSKDAPASGGEEDTQQ